MTVKLDILQAFLNTDIVIDWTTNEELLQAFFEVLEDYSPDTLWSSGNLPTEEKPLNQYLNIEEGSMFSDNERYLEDYLPRVDIVPIEEAFEDFERPDYTQVLDLL